MEYWTQLATYPSLVVGPVLAAAIVSGFVSLWVGRGNRLAASDDVDRKIEAERQVTDAKLNHEREKSLTDRAWTDYGIRRDIYLDLAAQIGCLFEFIPVVPKEANLAKIAANKTFHETCRKVRLIGSDDVVRALNNLTASIKSGANPEVTRSAYSKLMNAIRMDIRTLNERPPLGTTLDENAFPIES